MAYEQLAADILKYVGGPENVSGLTHCATRLRFNLKDNTIASKEEISKLDVVSILEAGGQFQVVIGTHVPEVYNKISPHLLLGTASDTKKETTAEKVSLKDRILDTISGSFTPLIPAMIGSGMIKALLSILVLTNVLTAESPIFSILSAASNAIFYFLPFFVAITFANKININPYIATVTVAALFEPNFTKLLEVKNLGSFLAMPIVPLDYSSQILPVFAAVGFIAILEKGLKKIIPQSIQIIFLPTFMVLITVPLTVLVFGPLMASLSNLISQGMQWLITFSPVVTGLVLGAVWVYLVMFGLHWAVTPLIILNLTQQGQDPLLGMLMPTVWGSGGIALGVYLKSKDEMLKKIAGTSLIPCFLTGVSEPILYGIFLKYRKTLLIYMVVSGILSGVSGFLGIQATQLLGGIFTIPTFSPILSYVIMIILSIVIPALAIMIFGYESNDKKAN